MKMHISCICKCGSPHNFFHHPKLLFSSGHEFAGKSFIKNILVYKVSSNRKLVLVNAEYFPDSKTFSKPIENAFSTFHEDVHYIQSWESRH